jgi:hypothetical protein
MLRSLLDPVQFVRQSAPPLLPDLRKAAEAIEGFYTSIAPPSGIIPNSTSSEDCLMLSLLVRHFRRRHVLDVGTNLGMTALALYQAAQANSGDCVTCDPVDYGKVPPGPRFIHADVKDAMGILKAEGRQIDFAFFDWVPNPEALRIAADVFTRDAILAVHDYGNDPKGQECIDAINAGYSRAKDGRWVVPNGKPTLVGGLAFNLCTAYFLPDTVLMPNAIERMARRNYSRLLRRSATIQESVAQ